MLLLASPANPTGNLFPLERLDEVLTAFRNAIVVLDEAYWGLGDETPDWESMPALTRAHPHLIVIRTFSKAFSLAKARIGYAVAGSGADDLVHASSVYLGYSGLSEALGLATLDSLDFYEKNRRDIADERELLTHTLRLFEGVTVARSAANFLLVEIPQHSRNAVRSALSSAGIKVKWLDGTLTGNIRITIGTTEQNTALLRALTSALSSPQPHHPRKADYLAAYRYVADSGQA